jgi:Flp pilus assembly protein protease CpaA
MKDLLVLVIFPAAMTLAAVTDLFTLTVPNRSLSRSPCYSL